MIVGPSLDRKETESDHKKLRNLYKTEYRAIKNFPKKTPEEIKELQLRMIIKMFDYAIEMVPLYKEKYRAIGLKKGDVQTWDDFFKIPTLKKDELIKAWPKKLISREFNTDFLTISSGSSGKFVYVAFDENAVLLDTLLGVRQMQFQSRNIFKPRNKTLFIYTCPWYFSSVDGMFPLYFMSTKSSIDEAIDKIKDLKPDVLSTYPSYLAELASEFPDMSKNGTKLIVVHSEMSTKKERIYLSKKLEIPVLDEYSSEELTRIALECPYRNYHIEEDTCFVEILEPNKDIKMELGKPGEVVGTSLINKATPLIRYRQGDFAILYGYKKCQCGSNFIQISAPLGRLQDSFIVSTGKQIPASTLMDEAYDWLLQSRIPLNGLQYQIVQKTKDLVDVFIVPGYGYKPMMSDIIKKRLMRILGNDIKIKINIVTHIPYKGIQKTKPIISLVDKKSHEKLAR